MGETIRAEAAAQGQAGESLGRDLADQGWAMLGQEDPALAGLLEAEFVRQRDTLSLVASSSVTRPAVLACEGAVFGNLTAEGYPGARFHGGCDQADRLERLAIERAMQVFGAAYANVQPLSASIANQVVFSSLLEVGDPILGLALDGGGHLSHGARMNLSGQNFAAQAYGLTADGEIDYEGLRRLAREVRPRMIVTGTTAYPRRLDFEQFRDICDEVGALMHADITHIAGLVAAGEHPSPIDIADVTTTCTHKQMFGPRGGLILVGRRGAEARVRGQPLVQRLQKGVFPLMQGAPSLNLIAAKAAALHHAATPAFQADMRRIRRIAQGLAATLQAAGVAVVGGGTDTHLLVADVHRSLGLTGIAAQQALERCGVIVNKNLVPHDPLPATVASGIRLGANSLVSRGVDDAGAQACAQLVADILRRVGEVQDLADADVSAFRARTAQLCRRYPHCYQRR